MEEDTLPKSSDNTGGRKWDRNLPAVLNTERDKFSVVATSLEQSKDRLPGMRVQMKQSRRDAGKKGPPTLVAYMAGTEPGKDRRLLKGFREGFENESERFEEKTELKIPDHERIVDACGLTCDWENWHERKDVTRNLLCDLESTKPPLEHGRNRKLNLIGTSSNRRRFRASKGFTGDYRGRYNCVAMVRFILMWLIIGCKAEELAVVSHTMRTAKPCARSKREPCVHTQRVVAKREGAAGATHAKRADFRAGGYDLPYRPDRSKALSSADFRAGGYDLPYRPDRSKALSSADFRAGGYDLPYRPDRSKALSSADFRAGGYDPPLGCKASVGRGAVFESQVGPSFLPRWDRYALWQDNVNDVPNPFTRLYKSRARIVLQLGPDSKARGGDMYSTVRSGVKAFPYPQRLRWTSDIDQRHADVPWHDTSLDPRRTPRNRLQGTTAVATAPYYPFSPPHLSVNGSKVGEDRLPRQKGHQNRRVIDPLTFLLHMFLRKHVVATWEHVTYIDSLRL
ncbi:hypothetical protein HD553DRAFT_360093 [Filobasidium floriforme]|uniref:uncharacterized protein n=1 Tax=Filobasidium floriforme TaxID=5210 RepID=UPI001E8CA4EE|nr:uncharacterized protein HD553DRAFT_360093 [Filobasidium floriforme]KAH8089475.1 hypothetical protein HD553DRAFT_360093 [Filobasidium floriforme]